MKFPSTLGGCADRLHELKTQRLELEAQAKKLKEEYNILQEYIIETLPKSDASGISGKNASVSVVVKEVPTVTDENKFREFMEANDRYDLAYKARPNPHAVREMWEDGAEVAGVEKFKRVTISLKKV